MSVPGIIPPDAARIGRGETSVEVETDAGEVETLSLTLNRACFVKGDQCAATRVDLIGELPPQVDAAQAECERLLGPTYFAAESPFLAPERPVMEEAERILLKTIESLRSPWDRAKVHIGRPTPQPAEAARGESPGTESPPPMPPPAVVSPAKAAQSPVPDRRLQRLEAARKQLRVDKELAALRQRRAKAEKNSNKMVRKKLLLGIDKKIALLEAETQAD